MDKIKMRTIDWTKTARNLKLLRNHDQNLRRYVCKTLNYDKAQCDGKCDSCKFDMDNSISQRELATAFGLSVGTVVNWENGKSKPYIEALLLYSEVCGIDLNNILIFED